MICITGDTHIPIDIRKLSVKRFPEQKNMTKNDYIIICGDYGGVWNNSNEDKYWCNWLNKKNCTILFCDGNHDNIDILDSMKVEEWHGGKVHFIKEHVIHLMRGQIYNIDGYKFFVMGGAASIDKYRRKEGKSWWKKELPTQEEYDEALNNLDKNNWKVDYVITHTASTKIVKQLVYENYNNLICRFFDLLEDDLDYKHWYFGHFHQDLEFEDNKHTALFNNIIKLT